MRYRLRTLLIAVTVACLLFALLGRLRAVGSATLKSGQVVVCRSAPLGSVGLSSNGKSITATFGTQSVRVDAEQIEVVGLRTVPLPASWASVELIRTSNNVQILLDGAPYER